MHLLLKISKLATAAMALVALAAPYTHIATSHHHEQAEHTCTAELEQDACHRRLVHFDFSSECEHDGHLNSAHEHCELCDHLANSNHYQPINAKREIARHGVLFKYSRLVAGSLSYLSFGHLGRGPPSLESHIAN